MELARSVNQAFHMTRCVCVCVCVCVVPQMLLHFTVSGGCSAVMLLSLDRARSVKQVLHMGQTVPMSSFTSRSVTADVVFTRWGSVSEAGAAHGSEWCQCPPHPK